MMSVEMEAETEHSYLVENVHSLAQAALYVVPALIPSPASEEIIIDASLVDQNVLREFDGVVIEEIAQRLDCFSNCGSEERVLLWELLRQGDQGVQRPCLHQ